MGSQLSLLDNWISNGNAYINKCLFCTRQIRWVGFNSVNLLKQVDMSLPIIFNHPYSEQSKVWRYQRGNRSRKSKNGRQYNGQKKKRTTSYDPPQIIHQKKGPRHYMLTTMGVLTWCMHKNVAGLNQSICISQPSLLVIESPSNSNTDINKQFIKKKI
jgi:hypothetical protein